MRQPSSILEALTLLFADDVKMVTQRALDRSLHNGTYRLILLSASTSRIGLDGSGTPITVFKLVKELGVQRDNVFSPSA